VAGERPAQRAQQSWLALQLTRKPARPGPLSVRWRDGRVDGESSSSLLLSERSRSRVRSGCLHLFQAAGGPLRVALSELLLVQISAPQGRVVGHPTRYSVV
jgi:hypothetical protein